MYFIKEAAQLSGVSVKTLHHYDKLGLLVPQKTESGYRVYSEQDLEHLQMILFYKYLGFSLEKIVNLLDKSDQDRLGHLSDQLSKLEQKRVELDTLIATLQKTIQAEKGERTMTTEEKFIGFTATDQTKYREQAIEKYGQAVIEESERRQASKEGQIIASMNQIFRNLATVLTEGLAPTSPESQKEIDALYQTINTYSFDCSLEVFNRIGQGYVYNPEFQANIDQFAPGLAQYAAEAIAYYVEK